MVNFTQFAGKLQSQFSFQLAFKDQSTLMKILSKILFFNPKFATDFVTTLGSTIYFPSQAFIDQDPTRAMIILAHESRHIYDRQRLGILFFILYALPQLLAPLALLLGFWSWWVALALFIFFLLPLPALGRSYLELQGYVVNLYMENYLHQDKSKEERQTILNETAIYINQYFTSSFYYFMCPWGVEDKLQQAIDDIESKEILQQEFYQKLSKVLVSP